MSNSLLGQGMGMMVLQNSGNYADVEPTFISEDFRVFPAAIR